MGSVPRRTAVLAASGKTGRAISAALSARGCHVVPVGRASWERLPEVLAGCDAVCVVAPNLYADEPAYVGEALEAAESAGVRRVVYHSVVAPYVPRMPHHLGKARSEDVVRRSAPAWTIL
jgi:NAD(P)H dehydrogenase (quinone)